MWILKGSLLGTGLFLVGTFFFLIVVLRPFRSNTAIHNPLFWAAFAASLVIGCAIVGSWPVKA